MISVGIRDLKNKLSQYLRLVNDGQTLLVRNRGEIVAEIRKYRRKVSKRRLVEYLDNEALHGRLVAAKHSESKISELIKRDKSAPVTVEWRKEYEQSRSDRL